MNERVKIRETEIPSKNWYVLKKVTFDYQQRDGSWATITREAYDRGNGATILLYNKEKATVILTRQFRLPFFINGNPSGFLIEACAGLLDKDNAEDCIRRETEEETGYKVTSVKRLYEAYMSPGSVTEMLTFFVAGYEKNMKITEGGGLKEDHEDIEVLEIRLAEALSMIENGSIKDAKTIMLLYYAALNKLV
jgi:GDP-mannose pyrophosphatase NudK